MKIAFDFEIFFKQKYGGISIYYSNLIKNLSNFNLETKIFSPIYKNYELKKKSDQNLKILHLERFYQMQKILFKLNILLSNFFLNKWKPNILHHTFYSLVKNFSVPKRVITIHDMIPEIFQDKFYFDPVILKARQEAINKADHIFCVSVATKDDLFALTKVDQKKVSVVYNGPGDFDNFYINKNLNNSSITKPYLLYVGKRNSYKNFINFIKAFSISKRIKNDFMIVCFGSDNFSKFEKSKLIEFNIKIGKDIIHLSDNMENIYALYKNSSALIYPSLHEGFGMPPLEAMKCGCPVIVSDIKPLREVLNNSAEFFDPNNIEDISYKIEKIIFSNFLSKDLIKKGFERSNFFSWKKTTEETFKIYKKII